MCLHEVLLALSAVRLTRVGAGFSQATRPYTKRKAPPARGKGKSAYRGFMGDQKLSALLLRIYDSACAVGAGIFVIICRW
jgi:hypothetical protein